MNLKLVVTSMSILGLVSCPVFAATDSQAADSQSQTAQTSTKHHHKKHHKVSREDKAERAEHKHKMHHEDADEGHEYSEAHRMPCAAPVTCTINQSTILMQEMTQNVGRALPNPCNPGWFNRIALTGGINVDIGKWGNRNANYMGENYQRLSLNDAYLNISAIVNDFTTAFASISYNTATINDPLQAQPFTINGVTRSGTHVAEFDAAYDGNAVSGSNHTLQLEQAFATFANFTMSPIFVQIGKQFQDFGRYELHPITESMTQVMSKTLAGSAKIGFIAEGFTGSAYVFDDPLPKVHQSKKPTNYGASLGFEAPGTCHQLGWSVGAAYLYNLIGANDVAYNVNQYNLALGNGIGYNTRVGGAAAYLDLLPGPFTLSLRYVTALQRFNINDLPKNGDADSTTGAKPWSAGIQVGYGFDVLWCTPQYLFVGYQQSHEAAGLMLPRQRWLAGYNIELWKNTTFGIEWDHDLAYSTSNGGTGNNTNLVSLRAAVKFS